MIRNRFYELSALVHQDLGGRIERKRANCFFNQSKSHWIRPRTKCKWQQKEWGKRLQRIISFWPVAWVSLIFSPKDNKKIVFLGIVNQGWRMKGLMEDPTMSERNKNGAGEARKGRKRTESTRTRGARTERTRKSSKKIREKEERK